MPRARFLSTCALALFAYAAGHRTGYDAGRIIGRTGGLAEGVSIAVRAHRDVVKGS